MDNTPSAAPVEASQPDESLNLGAADESYEDLGSTPTTDVENEVDETANSDETAGEDQ